MPEPTHKLNVFICHASQDVAVTRDLSKRLSQEGWLDPWLAEEKLLPGMDWDLEIRKAVKAAEAVVVCLSNHSVTKEGYVQRELRLVLNSAEEKPEGAIFILPIRLDDCPVPTRLEKWQYIDFFPVRRKDVAYGQLRQSLALRAGALGFSSFEPFGPALATEKPALPDPTAESLIRDLERHIHDLQQLLEQYKEKVRSSSDPHDPIATYRIRDLEHHIRNGQKLCKQFEEKLMLSDNPKEKLRATKEIKALQSQLRKYQKELGQLTGQKLPAGSKTTSTININTGGGAYIAGDVKVDGGDFIGRDKVDRGNATANQTANGPADSPLPGKSPQA